MKLLLSFLLGILLCSGLYSEAWAHGVAFYEFDPDNYLTSNLTVLPGNEYYIYFEPQNDFLDAVDLWIANTAEAGDVYFKLKNDQGSLLTSRTVYVSTVPEAAGGTRLHVDFLSSVPIVNTKIYSLEIRTALTGLKLYYASGVNILEHTATYVSPYLTGVSKINSDTQDFIFKYRLYEAADTAGPEIYNLSVIQDASGLAKLSFNANEPADWQLTYSSAQESAAIPFSGTYKSCGEGSAPCAQNFSVSPGTNYVYALTTKDSWGNTSVYSGGFLSSGSTPNNSSATSSGTTETAITNTTNPAADNSNPAASTPSATTSYSSAPSGALKPTGGKFSISDRVKVASPVNVRSGPHLDSGVLGVQNAGSLGTVIAGPAYYDGNIWWDINYDNEPKGWSVEDYLEKIGASNAALESSSLSQEGAASSSEIHSLSAIATADGNSLSIRWDMALPNEPVNGYQVDLLGEETKTHRELTLSRGTHGVTFSDLPDDIYHVNIYGKNGDKLFKVEERTVAVKNSKPAEPVKINYLTWLYPLGAILLLGGGLLTWKKFVFK